MTSRHWGAYAQMAQCRLPCCSGLAAACLTFCSHTWRAGSKRMREPQPAGCSSQCCAHCVLCSCRWACITVLPHPRMCLLPSPHVGRNTCMHLLNVPWQCPGPGKGRAPAQRRIAGGVPESILGLWHCLTSAGALACAALSWQSVRNHPGKSAPRGGDMQGNVSVELRFLCASTLKAKHVCPADARPPAYKPPHRKHGNGAMSRDTGKWPAHSAESQALPFSKNLAPSRLHSSGHNSTKQEQGVFTGRR